MAVADRRRAGPAPSHHAVALKAAEERTRDRIGGIQVNMAVGYGGRREIADAVRSLLYEHASAGGTIEELAEVLDVEHIAEHLYTKGQPDPDLVIRTSGEQRLSGFLLWQSAHSEFYFCDVNWPGLPASRLPAGASQLRESPTTLRSVAAAATLRSVASLTECERNRGARTDPVARHGRLCGRARPCAVQLPDGVPARLPAGVLRRRSGKLDPASARSAGGGGLGVDGATRVIPRPFRRYDVHQRGAPRRRGWPG